MNAGDSHFVNVSEMPLASISSHIIKVAARQGTSVRVNLSARSAPFVKLP